MTTSIQPRVLYQISYVYARDLRPLAESAAERAAVERLAEFQGSADDVRLAADLYRRAGEGANADELLRLLQSDQLAAEHSIPMSHLAEIKARHGGAAPDAALDDTPPNYERRLTYRFLTLPFRHQITVAKNLDVLTDADRALSDEALFRVLFKRAAQKGLLGKLWAETEKLHDDPADLNPFAPTEVERLERALVETSRRAEAREEVLRFLAQSVHQAHHENGTWQECPKATCRAVAEVTRK